MAFTKYIFYQLWDDASPSWEGERDKHKPKINEKGGGVTKIIIIEFHSAKIYYVHSVCLYLHGHEQTYKIYRIQNPQH